MIKFKNQNYLTKREFAEALEVSYNTVTSLEDRGYIEPALKLDKREFFTEQQVTNYWNGEYIPVPVRKRGDNDGSTED